MVVNGAGRIVQRLIFEGGLTRLSNDRVEDVEGELETRGFILLPGATEMLRCYVQREEPAWFAIWIRLHDIEYVLDLPDMRTYEDWMRKYLPILPVLDRLFGRL